MTPSITGIVTDRPLLRRAMLPLATFGGVVVAGIVGFRTLAGIGMIEAAFWLLDPTSFDLHFEAESGLETLAKAYAIVVTVGLVVSSSGSARQCSPRRSGVTSRNSSDACKPTEPSTDSRTT